MVTPSFSLTPKGLKVMEKVHNMQNRYQWEDRGKKNITQLFAGRPIGEQRLNTRKAVCTSTITALP